MAKGIYKRGRTYWISYALADGRIKRESTGSTKFKDAENLLLQKKQAVKEGKHPDTAKPANYTFRELAEKYLPWIDGRQKSADTKAYRINNMISRFGNLPLKNFNTLVVEQYQTDLIEKGLKPASVNKNIGIIKHMFTKAVEWEMIGDEVLKRVRKVKLFRENNRRLRYLSIEECQILIDLCDTHLKPIVITALHTGMRRGEILNLKWEQVDLKHGFILLDDNMTKNGERREIPIDETLRDTLKRFRTRLDISYVFYDPITGKPYKSVIKSFTTACRKAGIKDFHFHDLRHTFASQLAMEGTDLNTIRDLLGHKSITMTLRYSHLAPSHKEKAIKSLDNIFGRKKSTTQKLHNLGK